MSADRIVSVNKLTPSDIKNSTVTCIDITVLPEKDGKLVFDGGWKELIIALLYLTYLKESKHFSKVLYDAKVVDRDFQIYKEAVGIAKNEGIVYAERISGTPYFIDYDYSPSTICQKIRDILGILNFKSKDVLLTLKDILQ